MSFCCPIHGHYAPTPGVTLALCPTCSSSRPVAIITQSPADPDFEAHIRADQTERIVTWLWTSIPWLDAADRETVADAVAREFGIDKGK